MPKVKRSSTMQYPGRIDLGVGPSVDVRGYNKKEKFVCRVELNTAGLAVYTGTKGSKKVAKVTSEQLVERLKKPMKKKNKQKKST
jgi:hypothetical protein